jgi:hypothetical protein
MPKLTADQIAQKRSDASAFLSELTSAGMQSASVHYFVKTHCVGNVNGKKVKFYLPVKDYEKNGETQKSGTKSSLTLDQFVELDANGSCIDNKGDEWKIDQRNVTGQEYYEIRPCISFNNEGERAQMMIIDVDGIETNGDISLRQLFEGVEPETEYEQENAANGLAPKYLPEELYKSSFFLSRQKALPHFIFYVTGLPENLKIGQYTDCLNFGKGDILLNHAWERCDDDKFFKIYNYESDLITIDWETVKNWVDPESDNGKKLLGLNKKQPVPKKVITKVAKEEEEETASVVSSDSAVVEICDQIKALVNAILEKKPDSFDDYTSWSQLGFVIFNETDGSSDGGDLFVELSKNFKSDSGKKHTAATVCAQYFKAQPSRKKEDKLSISFLFNKLTELNPESELLSSHLDQKLASGKLTPSEIRRTKVYTGYRKKFEETNFKLNNPVCYIEIDQDAKRGQSLIFRMKKDLLERFRAVKGMPKFKVNGNKEISFIDLWLDDENKKEYSKIVFDPVGGNKIKSDEPIPFNSFTGFPADDPSVIPFEESESDFIKLMRYLFTEDKVFEYFKCWIAHIIQHPNKKTLVAPVLYSSTHGTGKNSVVDGIRALLGRNNCGTLTTIEDITKNFNSHLCNKLFIYGDEINANAKKVADLLKAVITRTEQNLEKKGVDTIVVDDYSNYLFTTNNENSFKAEMDDRRLGFVRCNEKAQTEYSIASYAEIEDQTKLKRLFAFFKNYQQSEESIKQFGKFNIGTGRAFETEYKKNLIFENYPAYIQMFFKSPDDFIGRKISSTEMHEKAVQYAKTHYLSSNFTSQMSAKTIKSLVGSYYKRGNTGVFYKFPETRTELLKELYNVESAYYRYIFQLPEDFVPEFKPEPLPKFRGHLTETDCESETD